MEELLARLQERKDELELTWAQVSVRAGVSRATISGWVNKGFAPNLRLFLYVVEALGLQIKFEPKERKPPCRKPSYRFF